jgi:hypothetical protein
MVTKWKRNGSIVITTYAEEDIAALVGGTPTWPGTSLPFLEGQRG